MVNLFSQPGIAEYEGRTQTLVGQGFLIPVLISNFHESCCDPTSPKEQSAEMWKKELTVALGSITCEKICNYWWADCCVFKH